MNHEPWRGPVLLDIPADPHVLFLVRAVVERLAKKAGLEEDRINRLVQAVDEACTNIIRHGYGGPSHERISMRLLWSGETLEVQIRDFAPFPDPEALRPRDLGEVRPGGLGLHFILAGADEVKYEVPEDGRGCLLRLIVRSSPREVHDEDQDGRDSP
jgi:anti-sigma regulatory factor (Ser/Thr protein kinase)